MKALEFYSGIGGLHLALSRSDVPVSVTNAFDCDQLACDVYSANYGRGIARKVDISTLTAGYLASLKATLWLLSPACQPYTVLNPSAKGELDPRAKSFLHLVQNIIPELAREDAHPTHFLVENVGGFETSSTRHVLVSTLRSLGYTVAEFLLTPLQFGIPNSRLRYYLLAKRSPYSFRDLPSGDGETLRHIPGRGSTLWVDSRLVEQAPDDNSVCEIHEYLDTEPVDGCGIPDKILCKWGRLFDIVLPSSRRTCCFTRGYTQLVERTGSILQMNEDQDTTTVFDVFLQKKLSSTSVDALDAARTLDILRLRYFSPEELLRLFAFAPVHDSSPAFVWPDSISRKTKYRLIGNSVNVKVVQELIGYLFEEP
ncbi:S-adenosyl-L-methionine-dependent methyltransferase [Mycena albidolilacea]|uniref:tRNA (cytosine(38)-C(5))-methyltransferase n=1 Tax=Mycena albidolilacea TaxID=1033008 RepID=A0AAD7EWW2_9AGAR|nr:S-adenosyl-L-methionine-dependent methyltransferase [Mycena albidolilacea]